jgi:hypothetical protein
MFYRPMVLFIMATKINITIGNSIFLNKLYYLLILKREMVVMLRKYSLILTLWITKPITQV